MTRLGRYWRGAVLVAALAGWRIAGGDGGPIVP